jgi:HlyD family secretion protein
VKLGISNDELQGITEGIDEGDVVVIGPARLLNKLNDGDSVSLMRGKAR